MKFYIMDSTVSKKPVVFDTIRETVNHLEGTVQRMFGRTRQQYMENLVSLGYGYDDSEGAVFTQALSEQLNIGVFQDGRFIKTNIHEADRNRRHKEMGD